MLTAPGSISIAHRHTNVEIGAEDALFPEREYINGIFVAVQIQYLRLRENLFLRLKISVHCPDACSHRVHILL
jgi:hypothetical protein